MFSLIAFRHMSTSYTLDSAELLTSYSKYGKKNSRNQPYNDQAERRRFKDFPDIHMLKIKEKYLSVIEEEQPTTYLGRLHP